MINFNQNHQRITWSIFLFLAFFFGCNDHEEKMTVDESNELTVKQKKVEEIAVARPPFSDEYIFPCTECHADMETNPEPRELEWHEEIVENMNHDNENRWCLDCHDANSRDSLRLASGKLLPFSESYKLCGQCHGDKLRDWKVGVHGQRTGYWNGDKQYLLCVHCHDPHAPRFKKLEPEPPPLMHGVDTVKVDSSDKH